MNLAQPQSVAKADVLACWCDALQACLAAAQANAELLLDATLSRLHAA